MRCVVVDGPSCPSIDRCRYIGALRRLVCEYVFLAQQLQPVEEASKRQGRAATTSHGDKNNGDEGGVDDCRLLLSINFVTSTNANAIASQQIGMERPVAVTRRNQHLMDDIRQRMNDCISREKDQPQASSEDAVHVGDSLSRALEWFENTSFAVSVISPADGMLGLAETMRQDPRAPSLADRLRKLHDVQFLLLRSDDERTERSAQNILHLLRAIKDSETGRCGIRQVENCASQLHGVVKEWVYRAAPSVTATIVHNGAGLSEVESSSVTLRLDIRSNYLQPSSEEENRLVQILHPGMRRMEIVHFVSMSSVHPSVLVGCPLHGRPSTTPALSDSRVKRNASQLKALARFLENEKCGAILRCTRQTRAEFFLLVQSGDCETPQFFFFRVASAEEVLIPPPSNGRADKAAADATAEDELAIQDMLSQIPRQEFNPFRYESNIIGTSMTRNRCKPAPNPTSHSTHVKPTAMELDLQTPSTESKSKTSRSAKAYNSVPVAKRKKLL